jgi:hypothetical protein
LQETEHNSQNIERLQAHLQLNGPGRIRTNDPRHVKANEVFDTKYSNICLDCVKPNDNLFWHNFKEYLLTQNSKSTVNDRINYAKKYYDILVVDDLSAILALSADKRTHVMKALTSLSKFCGCYDYWRSMIKRYNLRWSSSDSLKVFQNIVSETSYSEMLNWLKDTISKLPLYYLKKQLNTISKNKMMTMDCHWSSLFSYPLIICPRISPSWCC